MRNKVKFILTIWLLGMPVAFAADVKWHTYSLASFPKSTEGCVGSAEELAKRFTKQTDQEVFRALCDKETSLGYNITLTYVADNPVRLVSTFKEDGGLGYLGLYSTLAECQLHLQDEIEIFSRSTGLVPFVGYCFKENSINRTPYVSRIDGWGDAQAYPFRFEDTLFVDTIPRASAVLTQLSETANSLGLPVYQVRFSHDGSLKLVMRYYSSSIDHVQNRFDFKLNEIARYASLGVRTPLEVCQRQLNESAKAFSSKFATRGIWFCGWDGMLFEAKLYLVRMRRTEGIKAERLPTRYSNHADCERDKPSILAWYEKTFEVTPFSLACTWKSGFGTGNPDAFVMRVFSKVALEEELASWGDIDLGLDFPFAGTERL